MRLRPGAVGRAQIAIYRTLDPRHSSRPAEAFRLVHHTLVVVGIASVILATVPQIAESYGAALEAAFHIALAFFLVVYALRIFAMPAAPWAHPRHPLRDRLQWALSFTGLVDLLSSWLVLVAGLLDVGPESAHLAAILWQEGDRAEAYALQQQVLEMRSRLQGEDDPATRAAAVVLEMMERDDGF